MSCYIALVTVVIRYGLCTMRFINDTTYDDSTIQGVVKEAGRLKIFSLPVATCCSKLTVVFCKIQC